MARIEDLISSQAARFADDYEVYVDYDKGRPIKINENETTFIDIEKFLMRDTELPRMLTKRNSSHERKNEDRHKPTVRSLQW